MINLKQEDKRFYSIYGHNLQAARKKRSLTLENLADMTGYNRLDLSTLENGEHGIKLNTAIKLAKALDLSLAEMFSRNFQDYEIALDKGSKPQFMDDNYGLIFTENVKKLLDKKGKYQYDIWRETGIDPATVSRLLTGKISNPRLTTMNAIANYLGCELSILLKREK